MLRKRGFTLIELLVVIAIIGILASIVIASLNTAREKGNQASIKANAKTVSVQAELYYDTDQRYGEIAGFLRTACPVYNAGGTNMFAADRTINNALITAEGAGGTAGAFCALGVGGQTWAIDIQYKDSTTTWCADSTGYAGETTMADDEIIIDGDVHCQ